MSGALGSAAPGARRPRRKPGENRASLIQAGTIEFGLYGYAAAQTSAIAVRAGVSQPNVYANFSSKDELFLACLDSVVEAVRAEGEPILDDLQARLVFQAVAASHHPVLGPRLQPILEALVQRLGQEPFEQSHLRVLRQVLAGEA